MANQTTILETPIEIEETLQNVVADEHTCVIFECKIKECSEGHISYKWYKDGIRIEPSRDVNIAYCERWYRLEIKSVTAKDHGVYVVLLKNKATETFCKANLYVRPISDRCYNIYDEVLYLNPLIKYNNVVKHLRNAKILAGGTIELEAEFSVDSTEDFVWFKSNRPLVQNERTIVLNDKKTTTLSILCATETDSGIYLVVSKSPYGVVSTFASIVVVNTDPSTINNSEIAPCIEEHLPDELEVNEEEDVRLLCKATYDVNTCMKWSKNGNAIDDMSNLVTEYYNNCYICLGLRNASAQDSGEYSLTMQDKITGQEDSSSCSLTVHSLPRQTRLTKLLKPLEPILTCFGAAISLACSFEMDDPRFCYVVWYIGHFRVERTNHKFNVIQNGGDFILIIKQVDPGMAGSVTCELRKSLPNRKSLLVNSTSTYLTIVPPEILHREKKYHKSKLKCVFDNDRPKIDIPIEQRNNMNGRPKCIVSSNGGANQIEHRTVMVITYCRLDDEHFYLDINNDEDEVLPSHLAVYEKTLYARQPNHSSKLIVIQWKPQEVNGTDVKNKWYIIEFGKTNTFVHAGVSSLPLFEIKNPPVEKIMRFRISTTDSLNGSDESRVCILPCVDHQQTHNKACKLKPMEDFENMFIQTGHVIGCGAFGSVILVKDGKEEFYAAKILKTKIQKKRDAAIREYEMMRTLRHPKLVRLYCTFSSRDSFILVMDYLWGGELFDRIVEEEHIKEVDVVPYVRQICEALFYLHEQKIAHLDLKPENIICLSPNSRQVKIIDFGLARVLEEGHVTRAIYGTRDYVAPEVLNFERLTLACDMWSLGVVTYMLLSGVMPFSGDSWLERSANITMANYDYHESAFKEISDLAKDFVDRLLVLQPEKRMKAAVALDQQWIVEGPPGGARAGHMRRARENLKSYLANHRARWQRAGNVMIAAHRLRNHAAAIQRNANNADADRESPRVT